MSVFCGFRRIDFFNALDHEACLVPRHRGFDGLIVENWRLLGRSEDGACWLHVTDERHRQRTYRAGEDPSGSL